VSDFVNTNTVRYCTFCEDYEGRTNLPLLSRILTTSLTREIFLTRRRCRTSPTSSYTNTRGAHTSQRSRWSFFSPSFRSRATDLSSDSSDPRNLLLYGKEHITIEGRIAAALQEPQLTPVSLSPSYARVASGSAINSSKSVR